LKIGNSIEIDHLELIQGQSHILV